MHDRAIHWCWTSPSEEEKEEEEEEEEEEEKEDEEEERKTFWPSGGLVLLQSFFAPLDVLFIMKTLKGEQYIVMKPYKFANFEILRL